MRFITKALSATCIEYCFGEHIDKNINDKVLNVYQWLPQLIDLNQEGILDIVPSYTSLALHFTSGSKLLKDPKAFDSIVNEALDRSRSYESNEHIIYVDYNGEDLQNVCQTLHLSKAEFINLHATSYSIAMIGFREYFPYLLGLNERLHLPRRDTPRTKVKKGSVAIAAGQTGIYPEASPGGWHIIGYTDFDDFTSLKPSDIITFKVKELRC